MDRQPGLQSPASVTETPLEFRRPELRSFKSYGVLTKPFFPCVPQMEIYEATRLNEHALYLSAEFDDREADVITELCEHIYLTLGNTPLTDGQMCNEVVVKLLARFRYMVQWAPWINNFRKAVDVRSSLLDDLRSSCDQACDIDSMRKAGVDLCSAVLGWHYTESSQGYKTEDFQQSCHIAALLWWISILQQWSQELVQAQVDPPAPVPPRNKRKKASDPVARRGSR